MSDTNADPTMVFLRDREHALELEAHANKARLEEVRDLIGKLEGKKRGRRAGAAAVAAVTSEPVGGDLLKDAAE